MLDATLFMPPTRTLFASPFPGEGTSFLIRSAFPWAHRAAPQHHKVPWTSPFLLPRGFLEAWITLGYSHCSIWRPRPLTLSLLCWVSSDPSEDEYFTLRA